MLTVERVGPFDAHAPLAVVLGVLTLKLLHDAVHVGARAAEGYIGPKAREHATQQSSVALATEVAAERQRCPQFRPRWEDEVGRHHSDDRSRKVIDPHDPAEDSRVGREAAAP